MNRKPTQTELLDQLREMLQSIAITAVRAQDVLGNPDAVADAINDIESDLAHCSNINTRLAKG
jgi:succinylglutamate desuccinylase